MLSEYEECAKEWLFVSISDERLLSAKNKGESFYNLFKFPESDNVWCVRKVYGNDNAVATQVKPTDLNDADLPDSDVYMKNNFM